MKRRFFPILPTLALALALVPLRTWAEQFVPLPFEELGGHAELIVHGTVTGLSTQKDDAGRIFTRVNLAVHDVWKGKHSGGTLSIVQGGGTLGRERTVVSGQAQFGPGEEVVVFLRKNPRGDAVTIGLAQGKFGLARVGDQRWVINPVYRLTAPGGPQGATLEWSQFKARVTQSIR